MLRHAVGMGAALILVTACGDSTLSLEEYVERMQTSTDELEQGPEPDDRPQAGPSPE